MEQFGDRVIEATRRKRTPALVGLDPRPDLLPKSLVARHGLAAGASERCWARAVEEFCSRVLDVVAPHVPAVKVQSAFFELHGAAGIAAMHLVLNKARRLGLIAILDAKRGDIGTTSQAYAEAAFGKTVEDAATLANGSGTGRADALTVNPYLGRDSLEPFLSFVRRAGRGLFVLVRTSNAGSADLQAISTIPRTQVKGNVPGVPPVQAAERIGAAPLPQVQGRIPMTLAFHVAEWVREWSQETHGRSGYGSVGAVVGGTAGGQIAEFRVAMPQALLLIPGYGAQGATAADVAAAFDEHGLGALVSSSRGVLFPETSKSAADGAASELWEEGIENALRCMIDDLAANTPAGRLRE